MTKATERVRALIAGHRPGEARGLTQALQRDGDIMVVGVADAAREVADSAVRTRPDVIVLCFNGDTGAWCDAIEHVMADIPTPILVITPRHDRTDPPAAVRAMLSGALEVVPASDDWSSGFTANLRRTVRSMCGAHVLHQSRGRLTTPAGSSWSGGPSPVVAVGASTGGPSALATVLSGLGGLHAPVLVVQHLHPEFIGGFVEWMARASALPVELAAHGAGIRAGHVYFAPGGTHLRLAGGGRLELDPSPASTYRPSVDQLFTSVAAHVGSRAVGVLLTGIGEDGARGLLGIRERGGQTLAQDEDTCAVFGMPQAAHRLGAAGRMVALDRIAGAIHDAVRRVVRS